ncbi:hypothetical protein JCM19238_3678 [Vibrio ponticus]|nr:hypothetical protein JCM19238_3678 [Vibrio ponticus]
MMNTSQVVCSHFINMTPNWYRSINGSGLSASMRMRKQ